MLGVQGPRPLHRPRYNQDLSASRDTLNLAWGFPPREADQAPTPPLSATFPLSPHSLHPLWPREHRTHQAGDASPYLPRPVGASAADMNGGYGNHQSTLSNTGIPYESTLPAHRSYSTGPSIPGTAPTHYPSYTASQTNSRAQSRAASPVFQPNPHDELNGNPSLRQGSSTIHPYLQLPVTISSTGGSLTEFAAQTTCLFWFESSSTLNRVEDPKLSPLPRSTLVREARPSTGFLKWVTTILSTTQVTQNVVLLALLFIHRLKKQNPSVKGKPGSEFRLLTVALMLGNKFLDDNTYTNKTWAEVSGISVGEIHVMEVEFLSHMKYNLYTSKEEWDNWHQHLAHLWKFFNTDPRKLEAQVRSYAYRPPVLQIPRTLPSPPASTSHSPPYSMSASPGLPAQVGTPVSLPHLAPPQPSPAYTLPSLDTPVYPSRKRSYDEGAHALLSNEPPAKRLHAYDQYRVSGTSTPTGAYPQQSSTYSQLPGLPIPHLPVPASQPMPHQSHSASITPVSASRNLPFSLPPVQWSQNASAMPSKMMPQSNLHIVSNADRSNPSSRRQTPFDPTSDHNPPMDLPYASSAAHTTSQNQLSPSFFLHQRSSPYRPVRDISTLLVPPSSGQISRQPDPISHEQMHWQPLGRPVERQTGRVPYMHREAWPETNQYQHWPSIYPSNMQG